MDKEIEDYLTSMTNLLNGQLRGAINKKAREENGELISITIGDIFNKAYGLGKGVQAQEQSLEKLKMDLGITPNKNGSGEDDT